MEGALKEGPTDDLLHTYGPTGDETEEDYHDSTTSRKVDNNNKWENSQDAIHWVNSGKAQDEGSQFWRTRSHAIIFCGSVPADCIRKSGKHQRREDFVPKDSYATTSSESCVEDCLASAARQTIKQIDLRVQETPQNAALEDQGRVTKIQDLVHTLRTQSRTESFIADFSKPIQCVQ